MNYRGFCIGCLFVFAGFLPAQAQLNSAEKILIDSFSMYPEYGFLIDGGYLIGGEEESCNTATIWQMDNDFNIVRKKYLRHDFYEISEMYDMKLEDSTFHILTRQLEFDDVLGDEGAKWFELNSNLEIVDSLYIPILSSKDGLFQDSALVFTTWEDSLVFISTLDGHTIHTIRFNNASNDLIQSGSRIVSWKNDQIYIVDSTYTIDTIYSDALILDVQANQNDLYVLTEESVIHMEVNDPLTLRNSVAAPLEVRQLMYHPMIPALIAVTNQNSVHYYDPDSLVEMGVTQLFYNGVYKEDLNYTVLADGSILRLGTTQVMMKSNSFPLDGQAMGFFHRFNHEYSEDAVKRSNLKLDQVAITDGYYGSVPKLVLGDTVYIISTDSKTKISWIYTNTGVDTIFSGFTSTSQVFGFNCSEGFYTQILDTILLPQMSAGKEFEFHKTTQFTSGNQRRLMVYTAFPNSHYDADFSDNQKRFTFRYILSNLDDEPGLSEIKVFPNPANYEIHITSTSDAIIRQAVLMDIHGKTLFRNHVDHPGNLIQLNTALITEGMYFLHLETSLGELVKKISIIR